MQGAVDIEGLMPRDRAVFIGLPAHAVVIDALAPAVGDGLVMVRRGDAWALTLFRDGARAFEHGSPDAPEVTALQRMPGATVSAWRLDNDLLGVVPELVAGDVVHSSLSLRWVDVNELITDLRGRDEAHLVIVTAGDQQAVGRVNGASPAGEEWGVSEVIALANIRRPDGNVSVIRTSIAPPSPAPHAEHTMFDAAPVVVDDDGLFTELFGTAHAFHAPRLASPYGEQTVDALASQLKLIARSRLESSSPRLEDLIDRAASRRAPLVALADDVRTIAIRGVMQSTLEQLADEMLALGDVPG